eukprot:TRINITY_DN5563_c0_g1_i4.p1 TRINITY_DN5563_c0_g1~~TRINITY_DN5563_c0_g1_i4.p1  ORF type:complete len:200 (+),score=-23.80 TRINITY_DN5563_c0_g1_i4:129-728(+)
MRSCNLICVQGNFSKRNTFLFSLDLFNYNFICYYGNWQFSFFYIMHYVTLFKYMIVVLSNIRQLHWQPCYGFSPAAVSSNLLDQKLTCINCVQLHILHIYTYYIQKYFIKFQLRVIFCSSTNSSFVVLLLSFVVLLLLSCNKMVHSNFYHFPIHIQKFIIFQISHFTFKISLNCYMNLLFDVQFMFRFRGLIESQWQIV